MRLPWLDPDAVDSLSITIRSVFHHPVIETSSPASDRRPRNTPLWALCMSKASCPAVLELELERGACPGSFPESLPFRSWNLWGRKLCAELWPDERLGEVSRWVLRKRDGEEGAEMVAVCCGGAEWVVCRVLGGRVARGKRDSDTRDGKDCWLMGDVAECLFKCTLRRMAEHLTDLRVSWYKKHLGAW